MRLLLIEDEPRVASFLRKGLEEQGYKVDLAFDGKTGESMAQKSSYDLLVLDIMLPKKNGLDICRTLREGNPDLPIIMLTALDSKEDIIKGLEAGADDYVVKPFEFEELMARVRAVIRRSKPVKDIRTKLICGDLEMDLNAKTVRRGGKLLTLTAKEFSLLEYLLSHKNRVISRVDLLEKVWEKDFDTGTNVIEVYINYLRKKVDKPFEQKLIHTITGMGYILKDPNE